jgi:ubiquinone/menaquinone biosynthesis C-methylase UbiE
MKDNFSHHSSHYALYRPTYPAALFDYLDTIVSAKDKAWDCGTGNGQVAAELAKRFGAVYATDISQSQLDHATRAPNLIYSLQPAERVDFPDQQFDLVTVAQAIHWFDFDKFYAEVRRTAKKGGVLTVIGYGGLQVSAELDRIKKDFYKDVVGPYWDKERSYIDEDYKTIPFPFEELPAPAFTQTLPWTKKHFAGYINTWSAVKNFIAKNGYNPVDAIVPAIEEAWGPEPTMEVRFPVLLRVGLVM